MAPVRRASGDAAISIQGLTELRKTLKDSEDKVSRTMLKTLNFDTAEKVVGWAQTLYASQGKEGQKAGDGLKAKKTEVGARIESKLPYAAGVEFGARRNVRRIFKHTGGRATIVREGESVGKVVRRIESQTVQAGRGSVSKRFRGQGGLAVTVRRDANGSVRTRLGWNQFDEWRGNSNGAGYGIFEALRQHRAEIVTDYETGLLKILDNIKGA